MSQRKESAYFDEEDLLGYKIWVAELELLVSQQKQRTSKAPGKVDFGACYALLQKLHATIDDTGADEIKEHQRRCEDALVDILLKGCPPPVRIELLHVASFCFCCRLSLAVFSCGRIALTLLSKYIDSTIGVLFFEQAVWEGGSASPILEGEFLAVVLGDEGGIWVSDV